METLKEFDMATSGNVFYDIEVDYFPVSYDVEIEVIKEV